MATTMARVTCVDLSARYQAATAGTAPGVIVTPANNDLIPISSGTGTLIMFQTAGTGSTITLTNVIAPPYGTGGNVTVTLAATDFQVVLIDNDGVNRFDQGPGANLGYILLTYSSVTSLTVRAVTIAS